MPEQRPAEPAAGRGAFPLGEAVTLADLEGDPHPLLARLRQQEPVSWLPALNGWLMTRRDLALRVLRDSAAFTVDDPRFSTARVVGPSTLSLDGAEHGRHRGPFSPGFSPAQVRSRLPGLRLDPDHPSAPRGLVFRKPPTLDVRWDPPAA